MVRQKLSLGVAFLALSFGAVPAAATITHAVHAGTVTSGTDQLGIFGGGDLSGDSFRVTFSFNLDLATYLTPTDAYGGIAYGGSPLFASAIVTVNGMSYSIAPSYAGSIFGENNGPGAPSEQNHYWPTALSWPPTPKSIYRTSPGPCQRVLLKDFLTQSRRVIRPMAQ